MIEGEFGTVSRGAVDGKSAKAVAMAKIATDRPVEGDRLALTAAFADRGDHQHGQAQLAAQGLVQRPQAWGVDAIIVEQQDHAADSA